MNHIYDRLSLLHLLNWSDLYNKKKRGKETYIFKYNPTILWHWRNNLKTQTKELVYTLLASKVSPLPGLITRWEKNKNLRHVRLGKLYMILFSVQGSLQDSMTSLTAEWVSGDIMFNDKWNAWKRGRANNTLSCYHRIMP